MALPIRLKTQVKPGGVLQISSPDLTPGATVEVVVREEEPPLVPRPLVALIGSAGGLFSSPEEVDAYLSAEREAWED